VKKKLTMALSLILMAFVLSATPVLADLPGEIDSRWEPDPLRPGAVWWRDATNQNDIVQYYNDVYLQKPRVETLTDGVYAVRGIGLSNVVALVGDTEWVLIDSLDSPAALQLAVAILSTYTGTRQLKALIYTGESYTHRSGSPVVSSYSPAVYAAADFLTSINNPRQQEAFIINLLINGTFLTEGPDGRIGLANTVGFFPFLHPDNLISTETTVNIAGFNINLIPAESANEADMLVWLPDQKVLICGDAWSPAFPNIGPLNGNGRSVTDWADTLDTMMSLNPDFMVPTQGPVISSSVEINTALTNYRDTMQDIYNQTQVLISQGVSEYDAAAQVQLSETWASDPYLQPFANSIASAVKGIYHPDDWWFSSEPMELPETPELTSTLTAARRVAIIDELGNNLDDMLTASLNAELAANDLASAEEALLMAFETYQEASDNILANRIYVQALRKNAYMQRSNQIRNYYLSIAHTTELNMPADTTAPSVTITLPADGAEYISGSVPSAEYDVSDDSDPYPTITVEGWSDEVGEHTMTITATDFAGNIGSSSVTYTVNPLIIQVTIDIKPGSKPNSINLRSKGVVPVAVLSTNEFDARALNPETVLFSASAPKKWKQEDIDGDGDIDLIFHFDTQKLNLTASSIEATLTGQTIDDQEITGTDSVRIVPVKGKK
jgi:glyoxylase-like metal-dependent hydrolase (beta-lactamase superfamily II)